MGKDLLEPLAKSVRGHQHFIVVTDLFSRLMRFISLQTSTATVVASAFLDHWEYAYGAPLYGVIDNVKQFVAKFFDALSASLGVKRHLTTAYRPQTSWQTERFSKTAVYCLAALWRRTLERLGFISPATHLRLQPASALLNKNYFF